MKQIYKKSQDITGQISHTHTHPLWQTPRKYSQAMREQEKATHFLAKIPGSPQIIATGMNFLIERGDRAYVEFSTSLAHCFYVS